MMTSEQVCESMRWIEEAQMFIAACEAMTDDAEARKTAAWLCAAVEQRRERLQRHMTQRAAVWVASHYSDRKSVGLGDAATLRIHPETDRSVALHS